MTMKGLKSRNACTTQGKLVKQWSVQREYLKWYKIECLKWYKIEWKYRVDLVGESTIWVWLKYVKKFHWMLVGHLRRFLANYFIYKLYIFILDPFYSLISSKILMMHFETKEKIHQLFYFFTLFTFVVSLKKMWILTDEMNCSCIFQALDGFVIVLTRDFEVFYASETVQEYLGLAQVIWNSYLKQRQSFEIIYKLIYLKYEWISICRACNVSTWIYEVFFLYIFQCKILFFGLYFIWTCG